MNQTLPVATVKIDHSLQEFLDTPSLFDMVVLKLEELKRLPVNQSINVKQILMSCFPDETLKDINQSTTGSLKEQLLELKLEGDKIKDTTVKFFKQRGNNLRIEAIKLLHEVEDLNLKLTGAGDGIVAEINELLVKIYNLNSEIGRTDDEIVLIEQRVNKLLYRISAELILRRDQIILK